MSLNVVDSSGWLEYFGGSKRAALFAPAIEKSGDLIVPTISLYEVFKKVVRESGEANGLQALGVMLAGSIVDLDKSLAIEAARIPLPLADSLIYATALRYGATLWTQDADFATLPHVRYFPR